MNSYITRYSEFMFVYKEILLILTKLRKKSYICTRNDKL